MKRVAAGLTQLRRTVCRRFLWPLLVAGVVCLHAGPPPAVAAPTATDDPPTATSLRPGMTRNDAEQVERGELTREQVTSQFSSASSSNPFAHLEDTPDNAVKQQKANAAALDDEDDYDDYDENALKAEDVFPKRMLKDDKKGGSGGASKDARRGISTRTDGFATIARHESKSVTKFKVGLFVFVPTFGGTLLREYVRRQREAAYVKKGLEIQKAQYAEYFNVTAEAEDSDLEDALKGLKNNETDASDDDDDDSDDEGSGDDSGDDEDDKNEAGPRPKRPKRPGGGGGGGGEGGNGGAGDGRPNDEDLERLNQMFKKS